MDMLSQDSSTSSSSPHKNNILFDELFEAEVSSEGFKF